MNKHFAILLGASALCASALSATPAAAEAVGGTVNISGTVQSRCSVVQPGGSNEQTFSGAIDLHRLDAADGTLRGDLRGSTTASPADGLTVPTRVVCTAANPTVSISATRLNTGGATDPGAGYSNDIDYIAQVKVSTAAGAQNTVAYSTAAGGSATATALGGRIAAGGANNVEVSVYGLAPEAGTTSVLANGVYAGIVTVSIQPTA